MGCCCKGESHKTVKKNYYEITFGDFDSGSAKLYKYDYGNTKDIEIKISPNGLSISTFMGVDKKNEDILEIRLFKYGIPRLICAFIFQNSKFDVSLIRRSTITKRTYLGESETINKDLGIVTMLNSNDIAFDVRYNKEVIINQIIQLNISENSNINSCLNSLVIAKSRNYAVEKIMYLWIAFNGYYNEISDKSAEGDKIKDAITILSKSESTHFPNRKKRESIDTLIIKYLNENNVFSLENLMSRSNEIQEIINTVLQENEHISALDYVTYGLGYYFRCNYFHANQTINLMVYNNNILNLVNNLLEEAVENALLDYLLNYKI